MLISEVILEKLRKQGEGPHVVDLLGQKRIIGEIIVALTYQICGDSIEDSKDANVRNLAGVKALLSRIAERAKQIQETERDTKPPLIRLLLVHARFSLLSRSN